MVGIAISDVLQVRGEEQKDEEENHGREGVLRMEKSEI